MVYCKRTTKIELLSPCFLGDAEQKGVWRTPPLKALLREWWRIAAAPDHGYDAGRLRDREGRLFGNAWLESQKDYCRSRVRLSLAEWSPGTLTQLKDDPKIPHAETDFKVGSQLYLGYGPLTIDRESKKTALKNGAALDAGETNTLSLAWPEDDDDALSRCLQLIDWFGTIGGRCRNGWGSLSLGLAPLAGSHPTLAGVLRPLEACLELDWPHAIGRDKDCPLVWESRESFADWKSAMTFLARTKIGFRTALSLEGVRDGQFADRHLLAYPVTHHAVLGQTEVANGSSSVGWVEGLGRSATPKTDKQGYYVQKGRLASQLRFKLFRAADGLKARIYHTPCTLPAPLMQKLAAADQRTVRDRQLAVWQETHLWLDRASGLTRLGV